MTDGEMTAKEKGKALEKRTRQFAVQMIKLAGELPNTKAGKVVKYQMVKAGNVRWRKLSESQSVGLESGFQEQNRDLHERSQ